MGLEAGYVFVPVLSILKHVIGLFFFSFIFPPCMMRQCDVLSISRELLWRRLFFWIFRILWDKYTVSTPKLIEQGLIIELFSLLKSQKCTWASLVLTENNMIHLLMSVKCFFSCTVRPRFRYLKMCIIYNALKKRKKKHAWFILCCNLQAHY